MATDIGVGIPFRLPTTNDSIVYHYTSMSGFKSIVESRKLWISEASYLNDSSERLHFADLLKREVSLSSAEAEVTEVSQQFLMWLRERRMTSPMVFVGSFSNNGNLLSQWRGYCPNGIGVSIGFKRTDLEQSAARMGFAFHRCNYDISDQVAVANALATKIMTAAQKEVDPQKSHPSQSYFKSFFNCEDEIVRLALRHKHPAFQAEEEWRLISSTFPNYVEPPIKYRASSTILVPYLEFELPTDNDGNLMLEHVFVGPNPSGNLAIESVSKFLSKNNRRANHVSASQIPYRN